MAQPWRVSPTAIAKRVAQRGRNQQYRKHLEEVGQRRGVFVGMRRVDIEKAASVGTKLLDRDLRGGRAHGQALLADGYGFVDHLSRRILHRLTGRVQLGCLVGRRFDGGDGLDRRRSSERPLG